jgi:hypothetical protein
MNIFEQASRLGLRFKTSKGSCSVEDLWGLPLTSKVGAPNLDEITVGLHNELTKAPGKVSFVNAAATGVTAELQLKFDIAKHILDTLVAERDREADAKQRKETKQRLLALIDEKKDEALRGKPLEDLIAMANSL